MIIFFVREALCILVVKLSNLLRLAFVFTIPLTRRISWPLIGV
jgi:hypothetical protein